MKKICLVSDNGDTFEFSGSTTFAQVPGYTLTVELENEDLATRLRQALDEFDTRASSDFDMMGLAMDLRGNADGSSEGTLDAETIVLCWDYIAMRLLVWRPGRVKSDEAIRAFLGLVLIESRWFVDTLRSPTSKPSIEIDLGPLTIKFGG